MKFIDIGANLTDLVFTGTYRGKKKHESDFTDMVQRATSIGLDKVIVTSGCYQDCIEAEKLCEEHNNFYYTVGCHPTRCNEFVSDPKKYLENLYELTFKNKVVAIGECGLDYDRLHFCDKETQLKYFELQFELAKKTRLPMFLHCREAFDDFVKIFQKYQSKISGGVVHSFTGTEDEVKKILDLGLYIGVNGCSLKTKENIEVMKKIPTNKLMLETDCPWCDIRPTHAGYSHVKSKFPASKKYQPGQQVKGRNELCNIVQVAEVVAACRGEQVEVMCEKIYQNTIDLFFKSN